MPVCAGLYYHEFKPPEERRDKGSLASRPTMVLLHGAGGNLLSWPVEMRRMSGYRVLAVDLPGHGKSDGVVFQTVEENCRAVSIFLREAGVFSMILVGHSLGAAIALAYASLVQDQVKGLALLSAAARFSIPGNLLQAVADADTYAIGLSIIRQRFFSAGTPASLRERIMAPLEKQRSTILYSDLLAAGRVDFVRSKPAASCPVWIACGKQDLITPPSQGRTFAGLFSNAVHGDLPGSGHMLPLEQPAAVAAGMRHFLEINNHFIK